MSIQPAAVIATRSGDKLLDVNYTEEEMNGVREKELPEKFATAEYQVLLVAEKYPRRADLSRLKDEAELWRGKAQAFRNLYGS